MPEVSVIIPSYNCAEYISCAIQSVLKQTYDDFELIIIDDGSTDNTKDVVDKYSKKVGNKKMRYFFQENKGLPGARNRGIKEAKGKYIALLDADDELPPDSLQKCIIAINDRDAEWCIVDILRVEKDKREIRVSIIPKEDPFIGILREDFIRVATFFKKDILFEIGLYDESQIIREDWDLKIRLFNAKKRFVYINEPLYIYKIRGKSLVKNNDRKALFYTMRLLRKHHKVLADKGNKDIAKIYSEHMHRLASDCLYKLNDFSTFIYCEKESLQYDFKLTRVIPLYYKIKSLFKIRNW